MPVIRYDPFRDLRTLQEEVNRLFSTNLTRGFGEEGIGRGAWNPSVDIYESKDHIVLEAAWASIAVSSDVSGAKISTADKRSTIAPSNPSRTPAFGVLSTSRVRVG